MIKMVALIDGVPKDITAHTSNYKRSDNVDSLGQEFTFDLLNNPIDKNHTGYALEMGAKIVVSHNGTTIFSGVIISYSRNTLTKYSYKAYDYAYYLNKSEAVIQFNDVSVETAITQLCSQEGIPLTIDCELPTKISKIYNGEVISRILDDLLKLASDETGLKYRKEFSNGALYINKRTNLVIEAYYKPAPKVDGFNPADLVGSFNSSYSVENMCNRIVIISSSEKNKQVYSEVSDDNNIQKYGQLTHYEKIDDKDTSKAGNIAQKKLKELNKITRSFSVTLFGDDRVRSGRCLVFNQPDINLVGTFLVKNCTHNYNGRTHTMDLELDMDKEG